MMEKKIAVAAVLLVLLSSLAAAVPFVSVADAQAGDYATFRTVIDTDNYANYQWLEKSLSIGVSKWGEIIDANTWTGLEYGMRDAFANDRVEPIQYQCGWYLRLQYRSYTFGDRDMWAFAIFSDTHDYGGDWINVTGRLMAPWGGRKTSGMAWSEPIQILHDGPRRAVVLLTTHVYDVPLPGESYPVADVRTLVIINKVSKYVMIIDDVILKVPKTELGNRMVNVTFNRQSKWHLGPWPNLQSDVLFWGVTGVYDGNWHTHPGLFPAAPPLYTYYVAQLIGGDYVGFAAFWPPCTEYAANGIDYWGTALPDGTAWPSCPPTIPLVVGQWRVQLGYPGNQLQFRSVTVYGITDRHNARNTTPAILDDEVKYQLDLIFNPWDIRDATIAGGVTYNHIVGRDAAPSDSTGMISAANYLTGQGNNIVFGVSDMDTGSHAFRRYGATNDRQSYYYDWPDDKRAAMMERDPVTGNALVGVAALMAGGPYANLASEYFNDFLPVFAIGDWMAWREILCPGCWSIRRYVSTDDIGYAIIATCTDMNGTNALAIWGWTADDTYAACMALGTTVDPTTLPPGTVAVVLEIDRRTTPATVTIIECLAQFTEHSTAVGIHVSS